MSQIPDQNQCSDLIASQQSSAPLQLQCKGACSVVGFNGLMNVAVVERLRGGGWTVGETVAASGNSVPNGSWPSHQQHPSCLQVFWNDQEIDEPQKKMPARPWETRLAENSDNPPSCTQIPVLNAWVTVPLCGLASTVKALCSSPQALRMSGHAKALTKSTYSCKQAKKNGPNQHGVDT